MKLGMGLLSVLLLSIGGFAHAQVNALPPTRHILVYGEAQAQAVPDRFRIAIYLEAVDPAVGIARKKVEMHLRDVLAKLDDAGVPAQEVKAASLKIQPKEHYDNDLEKQVFEGISVSRKVTARFPSVKSLQEFLAKLNTSEEVQVLGVDTELSSEAALMKALRKEAIGNTRTKAEAIAKAYGVKLVGLYSVSDVPPDFDYGIQEGDWPTKLRWDEEKTVLDRIEVTGSRIKRLDVESFQAGLVTIEDKIYAVFLISE